ncbi:MAG TPA: hypothetical protein IAC62_04765 [Candidatus Pelethocola excrementipullorum]|nr:hypothetical protein [Candidatus Pelethocola excrementipullorum]
MLQICIDLKLFQYGMIAAGILGVWCLFWSNHFYNMANHDLKRKDKPKGKWSAKVLEDSRINSVENSDAFIRVRLSEARQAGIHVGRLRQFVNVALCACVVLFSVAGYGVMQYRYEMYVLWRHGLLAGCIASGLLMLKFCLNLPDKEEQLVDGWRDYFENKVVRETKLVKGQARERAQPEAFPITEQERANIKKKKEKRVEKHSKSEDQVTQIEKGIREAAASDSRFAGVLTPEEEKLFREVIREYLN